MRRINLPEINVENAIPRHKRSIKSNFTKEYNFDFSDELIDGYIQELKLREQFFIDNLMTLHNISNLYSENILDTEKKHQYLFELCYPSGSKNRRTLYAPIWNNEGRCLFCDTSLASKNLELDHFLPKSRYPDLSAIPINLIPTCSNCNNNKSNKLIQSDRNILNPYSHGYVLSNFLQLRSSPNFTENLRYKNYFQVIIRNYTGTLGSQYSYNDYLDIVEHLNLYGVTKTLTEACNIFYRSTFLGMIKSATASFPEMDLTSRDRISNTLESLSRGATSGYVDNLFYENEIIETIKNDSLNEIDFLIHDLSLKYREINII